MALTLYVPAASPFHRLHPVTKCALLGGVVLAAFMVDAPLLLAPLGLGAAVLCAAAGGADSLRRFRTMFVVVFVFTLVVWTLFYGGALRPSWTGFLFGLSTAFRLETFLAAGLFFLAVTRVEEVAYALGRVGVPYVVGFTLTLAFRLVPVFFEAAATILQAQRCRGLDLAHGGPLTRLRRYVPVIVPVFVGALRRADRMAMALELRGFNAGRPRTTYLRARAGAADVVAVALVALLAGGYVALWAAGVGALDRHRP